MRREFLLIVLVFSLVLFFPRLGFTQVNEYSLVPVDLQISSLDSIVEVDIHIKLVQELGQINGFVVPLHAEGTSNPVLDTVLTGGLIDAYPPAFNPPSLVSWCTQRIVDPYGPPVDPMLFVVVCFGGGGPIPPQSGLYCRMFYKVSGPGTLTFRTAIHSVAGPVLMQGGYGPVPINWPAEGEVGSFSVTGPINEYSLVPVDLQICPGCDSTVQVNININTIDYMRTFVVPLFAEGTSNPVLDIILTGDISDPSPPAFYPPSLVAGFSQRIVNPYGPPTDPMLFIVVFGYLPPAYGLYCRMFYKIAGPGTLNFRTAIHSIVGSVRMERVDGSTASINWPAAGEVGSFTVTQLVKPRGNVNCDEQTNVADVVYIISYLFKGGPTPNPLENGDVNCDGQVTVSDVIYLLNYLFKSGPPPPC